MLNTLFKTINRYIQRQKVRRELNAMSDRELADIGITRGMISFIVKDI